MANYQISIMITCFFPSLFLWVQLLPTKAELKIPLSFFFFNLTLMESFSAKIFDLVGVSHHFSPFILLPRDTIQIPLRTTLTSSCLLPRKPLGFNLQLIIILYSISIDNIWSLLPILSKFQLRNLETSFFIFFLSLPWALFSLRAQKSQL